MRITKLQHLLSISDNDIVSITNIYNVTDHERMRGNLADVSGDRDYVYFTKTECVLKDNRYFMAFPDYCDYDIGKYKIMDSTNIDPKMIPAIPFTNEVIYSVKAVQLNNNNVMIICGMNSEQPVAAVSIINPDTGVVLEAIGFSKPKGCNDINMALLENGWVAVTYTEVMSLNQPVMLAILSDTGELIQKPIIVNDL